MGVSSRTIGKMDVYVLLFLCISIQLEIIPSFTLPTRLDPCWEELIPLYRATMQEVVGKYGQKLTKECYMKPVPKRDTTQFCKKCLPALEIAIHILVSSKNIEEGYRSCLRF